MARRLINRRPTRAVAAVLTIVPFMLIILIYAISSDIRLTINPQDKLLPSFESISDAIDRYAFTADKRTGDFRLWSDTAASLQRIANAVGIAVIITILVSIPVGLLSHLRFSLKPVIDIASMIPPLAILPILFIIFGLGELSKVALIAIGITPIMIRDLILEVEDLPSEQLVKAQTLGADSWLIMWRVVLPQIMPRLIDSLRLSLGTAWLFLIAAEAIASESGLGYRIFLMRRYLGMDVILPYVAWITFLAFTFDWVLIQFKRIAFPWSVAQKEA